jgi:hypothetical protein
MNNIIKWTLIFVVLALGAWAVYAVLQTIASALAAGLVSMKMGS